MISSIISRLVILVFGTLYPAYASYKAVRTKNLKEYVKWMMYWIVFALFTCTETFTDVFLSWFPFYYEVKIVLVLWLLSPATKGSSILYRKFVHPALCRREQEIDEYIAKAKDQGYHTVLNLGTKGVNYATTVIMQTAIKGGGGLVQQIRKSYSLSDLTECEPREERGSDEADDVLTEQRVVRRTPKSGFTPRRSASESNSRSPIYFPEVDVDVRSARSSRGDEPDFSHIKSTEDISSGYSSADNSASLTRTASLGAAARTKTRGTRTTITSIKRPQAAEDNQVIIEELHDDDSFDYTNMPSLVHLPSQLHISHTDPPFLYQYVGNQIRIIQVLNNSPFETSFNIETNHSNQWDKKETISQDSSSTMNSLNSEHQVVEPEKRNENKNDSITLLRKTGNEQNITKCEDHVEIQVENALFCGDVPVEIIKKDVDVVNNSETEKHDPKHIIEGKLTDSNLREYLETSKRVVKDTDDPIDATSLDTSVYDNESDESDNGASFGTPDDSPKSKRKSPKGKYGKGKAPPPPQVTKTETVAQQSSIQLEDNGLHQSRSQENFVEKVNNLPNTDSMKTGTFKSMHVVNPIAEKKNRHKSKSPARLQKGNSSGIGKLLQLPGKLAFWNKHDDKSDKNKDNNSTSSGDFSRRSSANDRIIEDFESCNELSATITDNVSENIFRELTDDQISFKDASDFDNDLVSQDIMDKSDALQKLIEAKLERHPEYKFVSLHEEVQTISKSTDV